MDICHSLKLSNLYSVKSIQTLCQVVQLINIDLAAFQTPEGRVCPCKFCDLAVLSQSIANPQ